MSPTRFYVQAGVYERFAADFGAALGAVRVGHGLEPQVQMGPLIHARRFAAVQALVDDAVQAGAECVTGGRRIGEHGHFLAPTLLAGVPAQARVMQEEPFGPVAALLRFDTVEQAVQQANALPFGLASYVFTRSIQTSTRVADALEAGMVNINHSGMAHPELPFGGVKDSGFGSEGGTESFDAFLATKMITQL